MCLYSLFHGERREGRNNSIFQSNPGFSDRIKLPLLVSTEQKVNLISYFGKTLGVSIWVGVGGGMYNVIEIFVRVLAQGPSPLRKIDKRKLFIYDLSFLQACGVIWTQCSVIIPPQRVRCNNFPPQRSNNDTVYAQRS